MNARSDRLCRVARKYALDCRVAEWAAAQAEKEYRTLFQRQQQLFSARAMMGGHHGHLRAGDLAVSSEWSSRLAAAAFDLEPAVRQARLAADICKGDAQRATGRRDIIDRRIDEAYQSEMRGADQKQAAHLAGRREAGAR